jgi:hypothetical protein
MQTAPQIKDLVDTPASWQPVQTISCSRLSGQGTSRQLQTAGQFVICGVAAGSYRQRHLHWTCFQSMMFYLRLPGTAAAASKVDHRPGLPPMASPHQQSICVRVELAATLLSTAWLSASFLLLTQSFLHA